MKKKIFLSLLLIISLFIITGCAGDNGKLSKDGRKIEKFYDLKYIEPKGSASDFEGGSDDNKMKNYIFGEYDGSININYQKGKDYSEMENLYYDEHTEKDINGTTWRVMNNEDLGVKSTFYYTVYNDNLYIIELNGIDKYKDQFDDFIKNISFK